MFWDYIQFQKDNKQMFQEISTFKGGKRNIYMHITNTSISSLIVEILLWLEALGELEMEKSNNIL